MIGMKYENSMVKIADDIIRDQIADRNVQNKKQKLIIPGD